MTGQTDLKRSQNLQRCYQIVIPKYFDLYFDEGSSYYGFTMILYEQNNTVHCMVTWQKKKRITNYMDDVLVLPRPDEVFNTGHF